MPRRPIAVFAIAPWAFTGVFPPDVLLRLHRVVDADSRMTLTSFDASFDGSFDGSDAATALGRAEILITGWGCPRIDASVLAAAPGLRAVVHAAGTVKSIVDPVVFEREIVVSSAAQANAVPVADYTVAALVLGAKRAFSRARHYADGRDPAMWRPGPDTGLHDCTVGVIGASRVGRLVLHRLRAFDVRVLLYDPTLTSGEAALLGAELVDVDELCRRSDLVTVHAPALPETHHLLDRRRLGLLPDRTLLINTARGSLVDTEALTEECVSGRISAVLDVTDPEPLPPGHPLLGLPNVLITPHLAGAQGRELRELGEFAVTEIERFVAGHPLRGQVLSEQLPYTA